MAAVGDGVILARMPGYRVQTTTVTSDSSTFTTTETTVASVTASLISGVIYRVRAVPRFSSTVSGDTVTISIREDDTSGTVIAQENCEIANSAFTVGYPAHIEGEHTASATASKTFVLTGDRVSGTGDITLEASTAHPCLFYVEVIG